MRALTSVALACAVLAAPAAGAPSRKKMEKVLGPHWEKTVKTGGLNGFALTPPLPAAWPPNGDGILAYYAYAYGLGTHLSDGEYNSAPWGRLLVKTKGSAKPEFERLANEVKELGTQGVRPLTQEETEIRATEDLAYKSLRSLARGKSAPKGPDRVLQAYYCLWLGTHGVVAGSLEEKLGAFFKWLDCERLRIAPGH